jgi:hypothetical protein
VMSTLPNLLGQNPLLIYDPGRPSVFVSSDVKS